MKETIIEIKDARVSYREDIALRGVSLEVARGEFVGIVGPNGAGKTTLLTLVNGLGRILSGEVRVLGERFTRHGSHRLRCRVGYVPQVERIDPRLPVSVRDVVLMGRYGQLGLLRRPGARDHQVVTEALRLVGATHLAQRPIGHLSGGEQQRVAIARALAQQPEIFLLDEPTASLDFRARSEIMGLVHQIHLMKGLTTLYVTHDLTSLPETCNRVVLMKNGLIWRCGTPKDTLSNDNLSRLFDLSPEEVRRRRAEVTTR